MSELKPCPFCGNKEIGVVQLFGIDVASGWRGIDSSGAFGTLRIN